MSQFLNSWLGIGRSSKSSQNPNRARLSLQRLEDRDLPAPYVVDNLSGSSTTQDSLPWCVTAANNTDGNHTITFSANATEGIIPLQASLQLMRNITITGPGTDLVVAPANGQNFRVFSIAGNKTCDISFLTVKGGKADNGAGIYNQGTLYLETLYIENNEASQKGGGIYNASGATLDLNNVRINENKATDKGGGLYNEGTVTADGGASEFHFNQAQGNMMHQSNFGGGIYNDGSIDFDTVFVQIYECTAKNGGGVYTAANSTFRMLAGSIDNNTASADGGGIWSQGTTTITNVDIEDNGANRGGGYFYEGGTMAFTFCAFTGNTATTTGPGGAYKTGLAEPRAFCTGQGDEDFDEV